MMTEEEKNRILDCIFNIEDRLQSIKYEISSNANRFKGYLEEKIIPAMNDVILVAKTIQNMK